MKNRTKSIMTGLALAAIAIPGTIAATDLPEADALALAVAETEQQNLAWYTDLDTDALDNESCREDLTTPVYQPQIDGRVIVKGEITAAGNIACADIQLESNALIDGEMTLQWREPGVGWKTESHARVPLNTRMVKGAGTAPGVMNYVLPYNHPAIGNPVRVCIQTFAPDWSPPRCIVAPTASLKADAPA